MNPEITWETLDWRALDRLRAGFLSPSPGRAPCWTCLSDLASYDFTYGRRIGWKWDGVLADLAARGFVPPRGTILDWGCGSGIAGRRVARALGDAAAALRFHDRSPLAISFAVEAARRDQPGLDVAPAGPALLAGDDPPATLVVSHVLNELSPGARESLLRLAGRAEAVLWVEPGDREGSRALVAVREELRGRLLPVAPCTHDAACGLLSPENARHWCHQFAPLPRNLLGDSNWARFGKRAGIDLRSLPYASLVLARRGGRDGAAGDGSSGPGTRAAGLSRILGRPRVYKGNARILSCQEDGVRELEVLRKDLPDFFRALEEGDHPAVVRWEVRGDRIRAILPP